MQAVQPYDHSTGFTRHSYWNIFHILGRCCACDHQGALMQTTDSDTVACVVGLSRSVNDSLVFCKYTYFYIHNSWDPFYHKTIKILPSANTIFSSDWLVSKAVYTLIDQYSKRYATSKTSTVYWCMASNLKASLNIFLNVKHSFICGFICL